MELKAVLPIDLSAGSLLDRQAAHHIGASLSGAYRSVAPLPHRMLENLLPEELVQGLWQHFPVDRLKSDLVFDIG